MGHFGEVNMAPNAPFFFQTLKQMKETCFCGQLSLYHINFVFIVLYNPLPCHKEELCLIFF